MPRTKIDRARKRPQTAAPEETRKEGRRNKKKKHSRAYKPGSVLSPGRESLCHLSRPAVTRPARQQPTPRHRASNPRQSSVYTVLQPARRTAGTCRHVRGGLLPRLFTLTARRRRSFSVTLLSPREDLPVRKRGALRCPDFPPPPPVENIGSILRRKQRQSLPAVRCKGNQSRPKRRISGDESPRKFLPRPLIG